MCYYKMSNRYLVFYCIVVDLLINKYYYDYNYCYCKFLVVLLGV